MKKIKTMYNNIIQRCYNKNNPKYACYGGRGIGLFLPWRVDYDLFEVYVLNLPNALKKGYSIDRIDNNKGYVRGNLRWATAKQQIQNARPKSGYKHKLSNIDKLIIQLWGKS
jgi:hypothetical protein